MRGFDEDDLREVAEIIGGRARGRRRTAALRERSEALCERRPLYPGFRGFPSYGSDGRGNPGGATSRVTVVDHPLVRHKLGLLRDADDADADLPPARQRARRCFSPTRRRRTCAIEDVEIEDAARADRRSPRISGKKVAVCPILRAGIGMLDGVLSLITGARVGFIGLYRDEETLQPVEYYVKLPHDIAERDVILLDPMLATGNSTAAAVDLVKRAGAQSVADDRASSRRPRGSSALHAHHPDVHVVVAAVDRELNERGYIVPGLGDAGDRLYGTR